MSFPLSYILSKAREEVLDNADVDKDTTTKQESNILKRPCPFSDLKVSTNDSDHILPEAVDVLESLFSALCQDERDLSAINDLPANENPSIANCDETPNGVIPDVPNANSDGEKCFAESEQQNEESNIFQQVFDFTRIPLQVTGCWSEFTKRDNNYTRGCKWAPDGSCILSCCEDNILRIFNLPQELWDTSKWEDLPEMESVVKILEGEIVYDYCWYPLMNSSDPATACLISSSKNSPVHLWDGFTGNLRCSYRTYDQMDEITAARSLSFDSEGNRIFCGFDKSICIFNVDLPGRNFEERKTFAKKSGQQGIISCFAFTATNTNISAVGSYRKSIGIYSEPGGELECILEGQKGGVTQLQFSPDGNLLYSGGRKDPEILCWDMRNLGTVLYCLRRSCKTNQRMQFDISRCGRYVISGNHNGVISVWDTQKETLEMSVDDFSILEPVQFFLAHDDCVNGISIHPFLPLLCSSSGQRKFPDLVSDEEEDIFTKRCLTKDNSLRLWWIGEYS